ncbi:winged helix-turn-helix transcriptional regulator [Streptomyces sp. GMY02]|uniref:winged helix-turn-helix transcriptional regulator n=1 Tax=Streptomyces sp. GMY02 TaxID=1333528 RepID=UPI001C2CB8BF|nr:winged helix-turn-helix transcriptional regulator [Streptomyces sp. GMY02]QXE33794.1 winged helix-turn-helix transcriptional regulator [Streptomyces sp. GMY02]
MARSYQQSCFLARALDVLGERWTLLIVRELTLGPRRYGELLDALPGIGNGLLAARLKHLEQYDVVRRTRPAGAGRWGAYELGDRGQALVPVLRSFVDWGAGLEDPPPEYTDRTAWSVTAMRLTAPAEAVSFDALTQLDVGGEEFWLHADGERVRAEVGPAPIRPDLRLTCGRETFDSLVRGQMSVEHAVAAGELVVAGDSGAARSFFEMFTLPDGTGGGVAEA